MAEQEDNMTKNGGTEIQMPPNFRRITGTKLFRCSKTENMDFTSSKALGENYGIKALIDLRNPTELTVHPSPDGKHKWSIDKYYPRYLTTKTPDGKLKMKAAEATEDKKDDETTRYGVHHIVDLIRETAVQLYLISNIWVRILIYIAAFIEKKFKVKSLRAYSVFYFNNAKTLLGSYKAFIRYGGRALYPGISQTLKCFKISYS